MMTGNKLIIAIALMAFTTFSTRAFPFVLFGTSNKKPPAIVTYLGKYLPPAIICAILVYCFSEVTLLKWPFAIKEAVSAGVVVFLHLWKSNTMLSIFCGTVVYMLLTQFVFS